MYFARAAAIVIVGGYALLAVLAYNSSLHPGHLQLKIAIRENSPFVSWVMPGGLAWNQGVRPGMSVLAADGQSFAGADLKTVPSEAIREADLQIGTGQVLHLEMVKFPHEQSPIKFSVWIVGGMFALLGAAVILRRPDLHQARLFALFASFTAFALGIIPASSEPLLRWATLIEFLTVAGAGATLFLFVLSLVGEPFSSHQSVVSFVFACISLAICGGFVVSMTAFPIAYQFFRPALFLFVSISVLSAIGLLLIYGISRGVPLVRQQARLALAGILLGTLPLAGFTLIPEALGQKSLFPVHFTLVSLVTIPLFFAYAILQHQMLGIRRLIHRGMVYGITSVVLLVLIVTVVAFGAPLLEKIATSEYSPFVIALLVTGSVVVFVPLRRGVHWLVDKLVYKDTFDYQAFYKMVDRDLTASRGSKDAVRELNNWLGRALELESSLLFLGPQPSQTQRFAATGHRADEIASKIHPRLTAFIEDSAKQDLCELHWESDFLLLANLRVSGKYLGYILVGPKKGGDVFLEEERRLIASIVPLLALAIDKDRLSEELQGLNQRLVKAEEKERSRLAADLHDGPLQKAILIANACEGTTVYPRELALQVVKDLREISSRLRPAILDDLGLISALEWLLEDMFRTSVIQTHILIQNVGEEDRFSPDIELALFRVAQEAANNTIKHAQATHLEISFSKEGTSLVLRLTDNGVGFDFPPAGKSGTGLAGMQERVKQLNGFFDIISSRGIGTTIIARIPLAEE